jgi:hypothetical protein
MPEVMIAKCAEALALRKAFPQELSALYTEDEMEQADSPLQPTHKPTMQAALPAPQDKPWKTVKGMIETFGALKDRGGEDLYYKVLRAHGVNHANEFKESGSATNCYRELMAIVERSEANSTVIDAEPING